MHTNTRFGTMRTLAAMVTLTVAMAGFLVQAEVSPAEAAMAFAPQAQEASPVDPSGQPEENELLRVTEQERLRALVEEDLATAERLHTADFQLITPFGETLSKEQYLGAIASGDIDYLVFEPTSDIAVRAYGDAAVVRYESRIEIDVGGERRSDRGWHTDVYERHDGSWQAVWSQMTFIQ